MTIAERERLRAALAAPGFDVVRFAAIAPAIGPRTVVTDAGSTKQDVVAAARASFGEALPRFVPAHPIAGTENSGAASAFAKLYDGRTVILTPIPLTLIGIVLGHWLFSAPFTATSMIGFIALAGIIVRNSILLVDFIRHGAGHGKSLREVLLEAGSVRFKPILLTALAAMIGAATILLDPIFQGLAISLLFGLASSTLLTVLVIPAIYVVLRDANELL